MNRGFLGGTVELSLTAVHGYLEAIANASPDAIIVHAEDQIIGWNAGAERLYGYTAAEMIERSIAILQPTGGTDALARLWDQLRHDEGIVAYETVRMSKAGRSIDVTAHASAVRTPHGAILAIAAVEREVVERHRAERAEERATRLQAVATLLARALTPAEVARITVSQGLDALGNGGGFVVHRGYPGALPEILYATGSQDATAEDPPGGHFASVLSLPRLLETSDPLWLGTADAIAAFTRQPQPEPPTIHALAALPLVVDERVLGVAGWVLTTPGGFSEDVRRFLSALVRQCAQSLERARLYRELAQREDRLQALVGRMIAAQEEERRHVAYEVHDGLAQIAASVHQHLQAFASHYRPRAPHAREELQRTLVLAQRTVREARSLVAYMRPTALDDFGLAVTLSALIEELRGEGWQITYSEALGTERLPRPMETALYRVAQEALTNVRKHAHTTEVAVTLYKAGEQVYLQIEDHGCGFAQDIIFGKAGAEGPVGAPGMRERIGLPGMRERVALFGGSFTVSSEIGSGTRVRAEVPLPDSARQAGLAAELAPPSGTAV